MTVTQQRVVASFFVPAGVATDLATGAGNSDSNLLKITVLRRSVSAVISFPGGNPTNSSSFVVRVTFGESVRNVAASALVASPAGALASLSLSTTQPAQVLEWTATVATQFIGSSVDVTFSLAAGVGEDLASNPTLAAASQTLYYGDRAAEARAFFVDVTWPAPSSSEQMDVLLNGLNADLARAGDWLPFQVAAYVSAPVSGSVQRVWGVARSPSLGDSATSAFTASVIVSQLSALFADAGSALRTGGQVASFCAEPNCFGTPQPQPTLARLPCAAGTAVGSGLSDACLQQAGVRQLWMGASTAQSVTLLPVRFAVGLQNASSVVRLELRRTTQPSVFFSLRLTGAGVTSNQHLSADFLLNITTLETVPPGQVAAAFDASGAPVTGVADGFYDVSLAYDDSFNIASSATHAISVRILSSALSASLSRAAGQNARTGLSSASFVVSFSSAVVNVDAADFVATGGATLSSVVVDSPTHVTLTVSLVGLGEETVVSVALAAGQNIADTVGNPLVALTGVAAVTVDRVTQTPTLALPASNTFLRTVPISFTLPEAALAGSVRLVFSQSGQPAFTIVFASALEASGTHSVANLLPANPLASSGVASTTPAILADGVYSVQLSYQDLAANAAALSSPVVTQVTIDTLAPTATITGGAGTVGDEALRNFVLSFNDYVTGVDSGDLVVLQGNAQIESVTEVVPGTEFAVAVRALTVGTVQIGIAAAPSVTDRAGNALAGSSAQSPAVTYACSPGVYGASCRCAIPSEPLRTAYPVRLRVAPADAGGSRFAGDVLTVSFAESLKYSGATPRFSSTCAALTSGAAWSSVEVEGNGNPETPGSCVRVWTAAVPWAQVFTPGAENTCGATSVSTDSLITVTVNMTVRNTETLPSGVLRTIEHAVPLQVQFQRTAVLTSAQVTAYSQIFTAAAISEQSVVRTGASPNVRLTLRLTTSVQHPFKLNAAGAVVSVPPGLQLSSVTIDAQCPDAPSGLCVNVWTIVVDDVAGAVCAFTGPYLATFQVGCRTSDCPLEGVTTQQVQFQITSSNHCPEVADVIGLSMDLLSFETADFSVRKTTFLNGQTAYFRSAFTSPTATLQSVEIVRASVAPQSGGAAQPLFVSPSNTALGTDLAFALVPSGAATRAAFSFRTDSVRLGVLPESSAVFVVSVIGRARYAFQGARAASSQLFEARVAVPAPTVELDAEPRRQSASATELLTIARGGSGGSGGGSGGDADASSGAGTGLSANAVAIGVVVAAAAAIAAVVAAIARARRRRVAEEHAATGEVDVPGAKSGAATAAAAAAAETSSQAGEPEPEHVAALELANAVAVVPELPTDPRSVLAHYAALGEGQTSAGDTAARE
jgi:hypothetical protein